MRHLPLLFCLLPTVAFAGGGDGDISNTTLGILMAIGGVIIMVFSGARAAQQMGRLGVQEGSSSVDAAQMLYIVMGAGVALMGILVAMGVIVPATAS